MMKMTRLSLFPLLQAAGLALLLCACTSESTDEGLPEGTTPIRFQMPETRGVVNGARDMEAFSVWGWRTPDEDGNTVQEFNDVTVSNSNGMWTYEGTKYWVANNTYQFYAVHPTSVSATVSDDGTITISDFDASATGEKAVDLMTASATGSGDNPQPVAFNFQHELARIIVEVRPDPGITVSNINATLSGFKTTGTLKRTSSGDSSWTPSETAGSSKKAEAENTENSLFDLLLIPQSTSGVQLKISLDRRQSGETSLTKLETTLSLSEPTQWSGGRTYRYTIRIQVDAITFSDFTVDEWGVTHTGGDINIGPSTSSN